MKCPSVLIVGIGNQYLGDEGLGPHVVERLQDAALPEHVSLVQCSTDLFALENAYCGERLVLIIDAIQTGAEPGTVHCIGETDFDSFQIHSSSAHRISAVEAALLLKQVNPDFAEAEFVFVGIEPSNLTQGTQLSARVEKALPELLEKIRFLLQI